MSKSSIAGLILILIFISCKNNNSAPSGLLKKEIIQAVLWDVIRADAFTTEFIKPDTLKNAVAENAKLQNEIFAYYKISRENFYSSFEYYKKNSGQMRVILDSMINKANRERIYNIAVKPDTANLK